MKSFIAVITVKPEVTQEEMDAHAVVEHEHFMALVSEEKIHHYYAKIGVPKFWCIVHAETLAEAETFLYGLPFYQLGFLTVDIEEVLEKVNINQKL